MAPKLANCVPPARDLEASEATTATPAADA